MKMSDFQFLKSFPKFVARDGEPAPEGDGTPEAKPKAEPTSVADDKAGTLTGDDAKTFTQAEVNEFVVSRNRTLKTQFEQLEGQMTTILAEQNLSNEQRTTMEADLANVRAQLRTKEQQAAHEAKLAGAKHETALSKATEETNFYKSLYENSTIERAIVDAANAEEIWNDQHFVLALKHKTKLTPELDAAGNKTGNLVPRIEAQVTGEDGNPQLVLQTPAEAVASMKDDNAFKNFFKGVGANGVGQGTEHKTGGRLDPRKMTDAEYFANHKEMRKQIGYDPDSTF